MEAIELYLLFIFAFIIGFVFGVVVGTYPEIFAYLKNKIKRKNKIIVNNVDPDASCSKSGFTGKRPDSNDFYSEDYM